VNTGLAFILGAKLPSVPSLLATGVVGFLGYRRPQRRECADANWTRNAIAPEAGAANCDAAWRRVHGESGARTMSRSDFSILRSLARAWWAKVVVCLILYAPDHRLLGVGKIADRSLQDLHKICTKRFISLQISAFACIKLPVLIYMEWLQKGLILRCF
jgi:hypothetical protein